MIDNDFYSDLDEMEALDDNYRKAFQELTELYTNLEALLQVNENEAYWGGKSFAAFHGLIEIWKEEYLRYLGMLVFLNNGMAGIREEDYELLFYREHMTEKIDLN